MPRGTLKDYNKWNFLQIWKPTFLDGSHFATTMNLVRGNSRRPLSPPCRRSSFSVGHPLRGDGLEHRAAHLADRRTRLVLEGAGRASATFKGLLDY